MQLCEDKHQEVCFEGRTCPVCNVRDELQAELTDANTKIEQLKDQIANLET